MKLVKGSFVSIHGRIVLPSFRNHPEFIREIREEKYIMIASGTVLPERTSNSRTESKTPESLASSSTMGNRESIDSS
jgi:hypothetical protein